MSERLDDAACAHHHSNKQHHRPAREFGRVRGIV
jgi:hypothetical protein